MTNPVSVAVRAATAADSDFLADAHRIGHEAVRDARGGALDILLRGRSEPIAESFLNEIEGGEHTVLVATANDVSAGYLAARALELSSGDKIFHVTDMWVLQQARGIGLGSALMHEAMAVAQGLGCVGIDARALPGDRATKNFFESFGLVARTIEVHKSL